MPRYFHGVCKQCSKTYKSRGPIFCSRSCNVTWNNLHANVAKRPEVKEKIRQSALKDGRQSQLMTPEARRKAAIGISKALKGRKLTEEHKRKIGEGVRKAGVRPPANAHLVGPNHPNWKGGTTPLRQKDYRSAKYADLHKAVLKRDNFTCRVCKDHNGPFQVHHIKSWAEHPNLRYATSNCLTLCHQCHVLRHRGNRRPTTNGPHVLADLYSNPS